LETIRQYGLEQLEALGEAAAVRQRHLDYYTTLAGKLALEWHTGRQPHLVKVLDQELDNIRVAISNGLGSRQIEVVLELVICLGLYWDMRGYYTEELGYLDQVLALSGGSKISQGKILGRAGFVALRRGDISAARHYYERSLALDETQTNNEVQGRTLTGLGLMHYSQGNYAKARSYLEKVLALSEEMNEFYKSAAQTNLSMVSLEEGKYQEAARLLGSSMALARKQGGQWSLVLILVNLARLAMLEEDYAQAGRFCEEARALSREIGFKYGTSLALAYLGMALYHQARFKEAGAALDESLILVLKDASFPIYHILVGVSGLLSKIWLKKREVRLAEQIACVSGTISAWLASSSNALIVPMRAILSKPWK
jgi:non-specific serine/threonine protein kinase